jgi:hypothetical protein
VLRGRIFPTVVFAAAVRSADLEPYARRHAVKTPIPAADDHEARVIQAALEAAPHIMRDLRATAVALVRNAESEAGLDEAADHRVFLFTLAWYLRRQAEAGAEVRPFSAASPSARKRRAPLSEA